jgi:hypothetical protein
VQTAGFNICLKNKPGVKVCKYNYMENEGEVVQETPTFKLKCETVGGRELCIHSCEIRSPPPQKKNPKKICKNILKLFT